MPIDTLIQQELIASQKRALEELPATYLTIGKATLAWGEIKLLRNALIEKTRAQILTNLNDYFRLAMKTNDERLKQLFQEIHSYANNLFASSNTDEQMKMFITLFILLDASFNETNTEIKSYDTAHEGPFTTWIINNLNAAISKIRTEITSQSINNFKLYLTKPIPQTISNFLNAALQQKQSAC